MDGMGKAIRNLAKNIKLIYALRTILIVLSASLVCLLLNQFGVEKENGLMVFMVAVLLISVFTKGYEYGIIGAIVSVMMFNYFFTIPVHTFAIMNPNDVALMGFFLITACISSSLTARFQKQLVIAQGSEETALRLYEMSEKFINVTGKDNIIQLGIHYIYEHTGYESIVELEGETIPAGSGNEYTSKDYLMFPIIGMARQLGTLKVFNHKQGLAAEAEMLVKTAANQIGIALDRELIYAEQEQTKLEVQREHMKSSMLRSISHDFRTPLTGIMGDCSLMIENQTMDRQTQDDLLRDVIEQSMWLMKMMENVLSMTRIESGQQFIEKHQEVIDDIVYEVQKHVIGLKSRRDFRVSLPDRVVVADMDGKMIMQVLVNLLDNAVKHTQDGGSISLDVSYRKNRVYFVVKDDGDGIAEEMKEKIFDEFVSLSDKSTDRKRGIGLGLAICKEVVEAHGGRIWAENRREGGARFTFWLEARIAE
ncbi:MAG: ATP-binding protein [Muricomes sp.]|uniref:sensor histidine kinase n=1 Tax=Faecalicatena contorta TaxID=39482 RepID=UPI002ECD1EBF|nr:ATP-binding protein [Muricomes sp.]